jgi:hypothetical protein
VGKLRRLSRRLQVIRLTQAPRRMALAGPCTRFCFEKIDPDLFLPRDRSSRIAGQRALPCGDARVTWQIMQINQGLFYRNMSYKLRSHET